MTLADMSTAVVGDLFGSSSSDQTQVVSDRGKPVAVDQTTRFNLLGRSPRSEGDGLTLTIGEMAAGAPRPLASRAAQVNDASIVDRIAATRVTLLSRRSESPECDARFSLLTERLRKLSPKVSQEDLAAFQEMTSSLEQVSATLARIKGR